MNKRMLGFIGAILAGLAAGLVLGWILKPASAKDASLSSLRGDYQADYVLMVAEKYAADQDALMAEALLRQLSPKTPLETIQQALVMAQQLSYSDREKQLLATLEQDLAVEPIVEAEAAP